MALDLTRFLPALVADLPSAPSTTSIPGTMTFVDISGFTAMSERLARKGKVGAEEMNLVLNRVFSDLLYIAAQMGGDLIKFGGDALLLFFQGNGHETRASDAAVMMRKALTTIGRVQTSAGISRLRMSIGIHSGDFLYMLAGRSHTELLVLGPGATRTVEMESNAEAGGILLSPETARSLDPARLGKFKGEGRLLRNTGGSIKQIQPALRSEIPGAEAYLSTLVREHLKSGEIESEHRAVSISFLHFSGVDGILRSKAPASLVHELHPLISSVQEICDDHGVTFLGTDIADNGGKIILVAGAPTSFGNNEERILQATRQVVDLRTPFKMRAGLNFGHVFTGAVGAPFRTTYTILGDAVNLAARFMARAELGSMLANPLMLERSRTRFRFTSLEPFHVKGKAHAVRAVVVGEVRSVARDLSTEVRFVGRAKEKERIRKIIDEVKAGGPGTLVMISGEAGIGKSRLVEETFSQLQERRILDAQCAPYATNSPYFPLRWLLRKMVGIPGDLDSQSVGRRLKKIVATSAPALLPWLPLIAIPFDAKVKPTKEVDQLAESFVGRRIHETVFAALKALLDPEAILLLEDVHWIDEATAGFLRFLEQQITTTSWVLIVTRRPVESGYHPPPSAATLSLGPIDRKASEKILRNAAGRPLLPQEIEAMAGRASGNPLFLNELAVDSPELELLPESVESLMAAKIDRLPVAERRLLREAAVAGMVFNANFLAGDTKTIESVLIDRLVEFVEPIGNFRYRFRHALLRDAAYEGLPFGKRKLLHRMVGEAIESSYSEPDEVSELLSLHFFRAGDYRKAWTYSRHAGQRAKAKFANSEAATFFLRAIDSAKRAGEVKLAEVVSCWSDLAYVNKVAGKLPDSVAAYRRARGLAGRDPARVADFLFREGEVLERSGRFSQALGCYTRGLKALPDNSDSVTKVRLLIAIAFVRFRQGKYRDCIRWSERALEAAQRIDDKPGMAHSYSLLHLTYVTMGDPRRAEFRDRALPIYEEIGDLESQGRVLNNLGLEAFGDGRWPVAMNFFNRARAIHGETGDVVGRVEVTVNLGEILSDGGSVEEAKELFEEALEMARASNYRLAEGVALSDLGRAHTRSGNFTDAAKFLEMASRLLTDLNARDFALDSKARIAEMHLFDGEPQRALEVIQDCAEAALTLGASALLPMIHRVSGLAQAQLGNRDAAKSALASSLDSARSTGSLYEQAMTMDALADLAEEQDDEFRATSQRLLRDLGINSVIRPRSARDSAAAHTGKRKAKRRATSR